MKDLIQEAIAKIEEQKITPESKWKYMVKKYGMWFLFACVAVLGALSFSIALDTGRNLDWDLYHFMHQSRFVYVLSILPYFWIILIAAFLLFAFFDIRKTEVGYRYSRFKIAVIIFGSVVIFGLLISLFDFGGKLHTKLEKDISFYGHHMMTTKETQWMQPSKGLLAGTIISISENALTITDLEDMTWYIAMNEKTIVKPSVDITQGEMIKLIGTKIDEQHFDVVEIRPWNKNMQNEHGGREMRGGHMMREQ